MTDLATTNPAAMTEAQQTAILDHLHLNPNSVDTQALLLICQRYDLDPLLKHVVLIQGRPYVTRDGYLAVAHRSGVLDGIEIVDNGEDDLHWWAKVAVYRKDMSRPFTYVGRYPKADAKHMAKYGPEMAVKCAEVMALRRAFNVTGIGAADEQWEEHAPINVPSYDWPALGWADQDEHDAELAELRERSKALDSEDQAELKELLSEWTLPYSLDQMTTWDDEVSRIEEETGDDPDPVDPPASEVTPDA